MRNKQWLFGKGVLGLVLGLALAGAALGQAPWPAPPIPTVWDKLGVTGAGKCLQSHLLNPLGNHPGMEKKPMLKPITDPANLDPKMPKAVQAAAAIKQQEDLAPQKIKAIKYLATMGCGCYQKTVDVRGAMLEALDDCTMEVRLAAAQALAEMAGNPCSTCGCTCCSADVMNKLQDMACGKDAKGCFKESSADVRAAAQTATDACRRKLPPGVAEVAPVPSTGPVIEHPTPILPPPTEHPLGVQEMPQPVTPGPHVAPPPPQPLPNPIEEKKPLEVPAEPPKSSTNIPRPTLQEVIASRMGAAQGAPPVASQPGMLNMTAQYPVHRQPTVQYAEGPAAQVAAAPAQQPLPMAVYPQPQPVAAYQQQQRVELAAAPSPPSLAIPAVQPVTNYQPQLAFKPQPVNQVRPTLAIPAAAPAAQPVAMPAAQNARSYVTIVDIKPVAYEAQMARRLPPIGEAPKSEQSKVTLRVVVPGEK